VQDVLDSLGRHYFGGGPGHGDNALNWWETPWGRAEHQTGWGGERMWVDDLELLLVLCDRLGLRRPRFSEAERAAGALGRLARIGNEGGAVLP
jgi:hypothetical protein